MTVDLSDPLVLMAETCRKEVAGEKCLERVSTARRKLIFDRRADAAFWAHLAIQMKMEVCWTIPTACTDGVRIKWNPDFLGQYSEEEVLGVLVHEIAHPAFAHHARQGQRDARQWNVAADGAINPMLEQGGFRLPSCRLMPGEGLLAKVPKGSLLSAEAIYELLDTPPKKGGGGGDGDGPAGDDPGGCGGVERPASDADAQQQIAEWERRIIQAHQFAKLRGTLSAGLARLVNEVLQPSVNWKTVLRDFVTTCLDNDQFRWSPPNRRYAWQGLYLPSRFGEALGGIHVAVDTSGSIGAKELAQFAGELNGIIGDFPTASLTILYHDSEVCAVQRWTPQDGELTLEAHGGGGTSHKCVTGWIRESGEEPVCLVCFTDLCSEFDDHPPAYPVLWVSTDKGREGPWGRTVEIT